MNPALRQAVGGSGGRLNRIRSLGHAPQRPCPMLPVWGVLPIGGGKAIGSA